MSSLTTATTFFEALCTSIHGAARYNEVDQARPAAVLWPDKERQWETLITRLQAELPVLVLGAFDPSNQIGPAIWLRCMVERTLPEANWPENETPILYLPGVSKQELRAVEDASRLLQPLAELQYRGVLWTQKNGKDWTPAAFLQSADRGLGIEVAADRATREALERALLKFADEPVEELRKDAPLTASRFNALLNPDQVRSLLLWLDNPTLRRSELSAEEWSAFRADCRQNYGFDPETDGEISAAAKLGERQHGWNAVWNRFAEAPLRYPHIPELLGKAAPAQFTSLFYISNSWPQENEAGETTLRSRLLGLDGKAPVDVRSALADLEKSHGARRDWVWAELGQAPLACALPSLVALSTATDVAPGGVTPQEMAKSYVEVGWKADQAMLEATAAVDRQDDLTALRVVIRTIYKPWLEQTAEAFQRAVAQHPLEVHPPSAVPAASPGTCILFADGLRYDVGRLLVAALERKGLDVDLNWRFGAIPGVTATAKPAASPVAALLGPGTDFNAKVNADGATVRAEILRRELNAAGYPVLSGGETGDPAAAGWTEFGSIDAYGHQQGWKLARRIQEEVRELAERVHNLMQAGWSEVRIITDHGWLLLPGGLPDVNLPLHLTDGRKGRCARLKSSATFGGQTVPWYWDPAARIAVPPDIHCYIAGKEYEHGGLSPQECVLPTIKVRAKSESAEAAAIEELKWTGMRCRVRISGAGPSCSADLRTKAADATSSLLDERKPVRDGLASLVVPNDTTEGNAALVVILAPDGRVVAQAPTIIGG